MAKAQREKGKRGEREAAQRLSDLLGADVSRSQQYKGGQHSGDLAGTGRLYVEVKRTERLRRYQALELADAEAGEERPPLLLHRPDRKPWVVVCYLSDLPELAEVVTEIRARKLGLAE